MQEVADRELLRQYAHGDSHEAFEALAARHVNLVYSVGLRKTGNPAAAEEITQAVFIILARKARGLSEKIVLSGWLYHTARLTAVNYLRAEVRRARREQEAYMQTPGEESEPDLGAQIAPLIEEANAGETRRHGRGYRCCRSWGTGDLQPAVGVTAIPSGFRSSDRPTRRSSFAGS